jgi:DegV family protein with EDD domain
MAQGLMVIEAGKMAASGFRQLEIAKNMEEVKKKISGRAITPNIDYLEKGGRVKNRAELSFGKLLKINPIVDIDHNEAVAIEKIPGKKLAMSWLMKNFIGEQNLERVVVLDFEARETTDEFIQRLIKNEIPEDIIYRGKLGPVTGAHGGPGTWAVIIEKRVA